MTARNLAAAVGQGHFGAKPPRQVQFEMQSQMQMHREMLLRKSDQLTLFEGGFLDGDRSHAPATSAPHPDAAAAHPGARANSPPPLYSNFEANFDLGLDEGVDEAALFDFLNA